MIEHIEKNRDSSKQEEHRRKVISDYGMLIGTLIAGIATVLAWNEARLTRKAAHEDADNSLKIQQQSAESQKKSVNAQIRQGEDSMRLQIEAFKEQRNQSVKSLQLQSQALGTQIDSVKSQIKSQEQAAEPFVSIEPILTKDGYAEDGKDIVHEDSEVAIELGKAGLKLEPQDKNRYVFFSIKSSGSTPAIAVRWISVCAPLSESEPREVSQAIAYEGMLQYTAKDLLKGKDVVGTLFGADSRKVFCILNESPTLMAFMFSYSDVFGHYHRVTYFFEGYKSPKGIEVFYLGLPRIENVPAPKDSLIRLTPFNASPP
ncbi:MAG TPA: hypothetical protein VN922_13375 [Bacteroidia bacterium]|nr:hypothetical protein [Bacteroidia bacterium]